MTIDALIMLAGALVALLPFLGFPNSWDTVLFFIAGIFIVALGIIVRRQGDQSRVKSRERTTEFVENTPRAQSGTSARAGEHEIA